MAKDFVNRQLSVVAIWLLLSVAAVYLYIFEPGKNGFFPVCPFRAITGFTCPGCGSTRAFHQLLHGHFSEAFKLNPLFMIALPIFLGILIRHTVFFTRGKVPKGNLLPAGVIYAVFFVIVSFWIFRNTAIYPFVS